MPAPDLLAIDAAREAARIEAILREQVRGRLRRRGVVVGVSGGVDSAVVAGLCARALGPERVLALLMPERDGSEASLPDGRAVADTFGVPFRVEDLTATLEALGCYARQAEAVRAVFPDYGDGWRCKITLPSLLDGDRLNVFRLTVRSPGGEERTARLPRDAYLQLVAATSFKQRTRKMMERYHADRLVYAVAGTPNRLEHALGFFVKGGDGDADVKPIAHLYKTQVQALAEHLGVPAAVRDKPPSTETFSLPQTQEEFFFALPLPLMDGCLAARDAGLDPAEAAPRVGLTADEVARVYRDIDARRRTTAWLHAAPLLAAPDEGG